MTTMVNSKKTLLAGAAICIAMLSNAAFADRGHYHPHRGGGRVHFGITLGAPLWYPGPGYYYAPYPAYAYPPAVIVRPAPRVYVERDDQVALEQAPPPPVQQYWYYCRDSETYYPYVKECASPWERVPARPSAP